MQWKFWKRGRRKRAEPAPAVATPSDDAQGPLLPVSTVKEVLGLQQVIGNQAVLRILAGGNRSAEDNRLPGGR
jgi:hypothetical protein